MSDSRRACSLGMVMLFLSSLLSETALAIVLHPGEGEPNLVEWTDRPHDDVMGRWANNASCVVISPNCVVTTRHQGADVGTAVHIGQTLYHVEQIWNYPDTTDPESSDYGAVDLRIAKLAEADLAHYVNLFAGADSNLLDADIVIGGYGLGRGDELKTSDMIYGYAWQDESICGNQCLRWCTNRIDTIQDNVKVQNNYSELDTNQDCVIADFDDPQATRYEGAVAGSDSGCGWFVKVDEQWQLAGLAWGVEHAQESQTWFRSKADPTIPHPEELNALRMSSYAAWVSDILETVCVPTQPADINNDCRIDLIDLARLAAKWRRQGCLESNFCNGSDINGDGNVDLTDLAEITANYPKEEG